MSESLLNRWLRSAECCGYPLRVPFYLIMMAAGGANAAVVLLADPAGFRDVAQGKERAHDKRSSNRKHDGSENKNPNDSQHGCHDHKENGVSDK
jgi:hypothetical protein